MTAHNPLIRATEILDYLSQTARRPQTVSDIARACGMPEPSCYRILRTLVDLDWVQQNGPRQPYQLGPRAWAMTNGQAYQTDIINLIRGPAQELAEYIKLIIVVAVLNRTRRQTLAWFHPRTHLSRLNHPRETDDVYSSSGGRLLLAMLPRKQRLPLIAAIGEPGRSWPGVLNEQELHQPLMIFVGKNPAPSNVAPLQRNQPCSPSPLNSTLNTLPLAPFLTNTKDIMRTKFYMRSR